jgi:hypothetical protein
VEVAGEKDSCMKALEDPHLRLVRPATPLTPEGCQECPELGTDWVHLRLCLTPIRRARAHAHALAHPIIQPFEPGESWRWCYADEAYV